MTSHVTVLVVDDEAPIRRSAAERLRREGYDVIEAGSGLDALERVRTGADVVLLDCNPANIDGVAVLRRFREREPDTVVIMLTRDATAVAATEASRIGAHRFVRKPIDVDDLSLMASQLVEAARLRRELRMLRAGQAQPYSFDRIVGESPTMIVLKERLHQAAACSASAVLLTGDSGTGKDLAARVLHFNSKRAMRPFVTIDCSAIPEPPLDIELFGAEGIGVPNGQQQQRRGLFESADGGTILLDGIGETGPGVQAKLLRLLEENALRRVGGSRDISVDVRVIAATTRSLEELVKAGRFREELHTRLSVLPIELPPLRTHRDDVPSLISFYVEVYNREFRKAVRAASLPALRAPGLWLAGQRSRSAQCCRAGDAPSGKRLARAARLPGAGDECTGRKRHPVTLGRSASGGARAQPRRPGARAQRRQPDARGRASRVESRSDEVSNRQVQSHQTPCRRCR
jgi:DNA-binding NtrC family response regulator